MRISDWSSDVCSSDLLRGSLPELDGEAALPGLSTAATVQRDRLGVVTIDAASEADAMRALGYVHAQERYFGMDLMRRTAAGEQIGRHTSELQSLMRSSYAVFCVTKNSNNDTTSIKKKVQNKQEII